VRAEGGATCRTIRKRNETKRNETKPNRVDADVVYTVLARLSFVRAADGTHLARPTDVRLYDPLIGTLCASGSRVPRDAASRVRVVLVYERTSGWRSKASEAESKGVEGGD
jgi:hypothetical protein